ncbi:MAG: protein kinase [Pleurocapsa sp.]
MDANLAGQTIYNRYHIIKQLGRGGVGITFLAEDLQCFNSQCVVKQLKPKSDNPNTLKVARRLFNQEAQILNNLGHCDRIPRLLAYFEYNNDFFLVQELIEGVDLSQEILPAQPWSEARTITLLQDILEVLQVVQQHNVIHRDLKPSNLMRRNKDGKIVLIDFGSVKQVSTQIVDASGQAKPTVAVGTKSYMPMEQMMGRPGLYSDLYAVGAIAIQALTGIIPKQLPVDRDGELIWRDKLNHQFRYNPQLLNLLDKMVRYRFQERYGTASEVLRDLAQIKANYDNLDEDTTTIIVKSKPKPPANSTPVLETRITSNNHQLDSDRRLPTEIATGHRNLQNVARQSHSSPRAKFKSPIIFMATGVIAILGIALGLWKSNTSNSLHLAHYESQEQGFKISYPAEWSKHNRDDFIATGVIFISPKEDANDFPEEVSVLVEQLPANTSLAKYTEESLNEIKRLSDPKTGNPEIANVGDREGRKVIYRGEENGHSVQRMQTWLVQNNIAYVITYTASPEQYETYLPEVENMLESFAIIPK